MAHPARAALLCALLTGVPLFLVGCGGGSSTPKTPNEIIGDIDKIFAQDYDNKEFDKVANLYASDAVLVPPTADRFVNQSEIEDFFNTSYKEGLHSIQLRPKIVVRGSDTVMHEIGTVDNLENPYYVRWVKNGDDWKISTDIMSIGGNLTKPNKTTQKPTVVGATNGTDPMAIITAMDKEWSKRFNAGNISGVVDLYAADAQLIPPIEPVAKGETVKIPNFKIRSELADFWNQTYLEIKHITLTPSKVLMEGGDVIHEIGTAGGNITDPNPYYGRWVKVGEDWKLSMSIVSIGVGGKSVKMQQSKTVVV